MQGLRLKILFYIHSLNGGGAERVTTSLSCRLADLGHEVGLITMTSAEGDFYPLDRRVRRITLDLASSSRGFDRLTANYRRWKALRRILKTERPDVVVAMMTTSIVLAILATIGLAVHVYGSERNYPGRDATRRPWRLLRRSVYRFADGHVAQTAETAAWLKRYTGARHVHVIANPVIWPIPSFPPRTDPDDVLSSERKTVLAVGSKPRQKGFDLLVRAFAALADDFPEWDLVILGVDPGNPDLASIQQLASDAGFAQRLLLPGRVGNIADWYRRADLFVLSSRYEGFPNVLLEAMACGCPCVAFDCTTGPRDMIEDGVNGVLVPADSVEELTRAMVRLMADSGLRSAMASRAVSVKETFSEMRIMQLWRRVLQ